MIHGIEIKSTKSTGNKNSLSLTLSPLDCTHSYYKIAILQMRRHWRRKLRSSAYVFISKHESRAGEETPIDDTWDSLSLALWIFCNCLLLWFSYFSSRRLNNKKNISTTNKKKNEKRRRRRVDAVKGERDGREKVK